MFRSILFCAVFLFFAAIKPSQAEFRHVANGAGFELSFVIPDDFHPTFGTAGFVDFKYSIGPAGHLSFRPNVDIWFSAGERGRYDDRYDQFIFQMAFNGDVRYYFPLPKTVKVRPFVGNGLAMTLFVVNRDYHNSNNRDYTETDPGMGFNFQTGIDFPFSSTTLGFTELKIKRSRYDSFKMTFGLQFLF